MRNSEETPGRTTEPASLHNDNGCSDKAHAAVVAVLHRDIGAILPKPRRYALILTRDAADDDDLVQECVVRALAKMHLWTAGTDLRAWSFMILHNQYISHVRRATRERSILEWNDAVSGSICAPRQMAQLELRELERAIRSLPGEQRSVILLVGLTRATYDEVATACDVPVGTIRSRLSRGRRALRKLTGVAPPQHARARKPSRSESAATAA
jgi:RNA polymerase sigma-70 factor, ECF subfamily